MTLAQLRYFQAVCKYNSISKASESLHVSQPAVSIAISNLESEFGLSFFSRDNRSLTITQAGALFLTLTNELLSNVDSMYNQMQAIRSATHPLRLSVVPFSFAQLLHSILKEYRARTPGTQVQVFEYTAQEAIRHLKSNTIDAALTVDVQEYPAFISGLRLFQVPSVLAVGRGHRLEGAPSCTLSDLAQESLIFAKEDSHLTRQVKSRFHELGISPNVVLYTAHLSLIESSLQNDGNIAIISQTLAQQLDHISLIPIQDGVKITHLLLWKRSSHLLPPITSFIKTVRLFYPDARPLQPEQNEGNA